MLSSILIVNHDVELPKTYFQVSFLSIVCELLMQTRIGSIILFIF